MGQPTEEPSGLPWSSSTVKRKLGLLICEEGESDVCQGACTGQENDGFNTDLERRPENQGKSAAEPSPGNVPRRRVQGCWEAPGWLMGASPHSPHVGGRCGHCLAPGAEICKDPAAGEGAWARVLGSCVTRGSKT